MSKFYSSECLSFRYNPETGVAYRRLDFLDLPGYRVGTDGSVWTLWVRHRLGYGKGTEFLLQSKWRLLKPGLCMKYPILYPHVKGRKSKGKGTLIHLLVLLAFAGERPTDRKCFGLHKNDRKTDNRLENLRWDTGRANSIDAIRNGRRVYAKGSDCHLAKLSDSEVIEIRRLFDSGLETDYCALGRDFDKSPGTIRFIVHRITWRHLP